MNPAAYEHQWRTPFFSLSCEESLCIPVRFFQCDATVWLLKIIGKCFRSPAGGGCLCAEAMGWKNGIPEDFQIDLCRLHRVDHPTTSLYPSPFHLKTKFAIAVSSRLISTKISNAQQIVCNNKHRFTHVIILNLAWSFSQHIFVRREAVTNVAVHNLKIVKNNIIFVIVILDLKMKYSIAIFKTKPKQISL